MMSVSKVFISTLILLVLAEINSAADCTCNKWKGTICGGHEKGLSGTCDKDTLYECQGREHRKAEVNTKCKVECKVDLDHRGIDKCDDKCTCGKWLGTVCGYRVNDDEPALIGDCDVKGFYNCKGDGSVPDHKGTCNKCDYGTKPGQDQCGDSF